MSSDEFWELTPYEFNSIALQSIEEDRRRKTEIRAQLWYGAALPRMKTFPQWDQFVEPKTSEEIHEDYEEAEQWYEQLLAERGYDEHGRKDC